MKKIFENKITELKAQYEGTENLALKNLLDEAMRITQKSAEVSEELNKKKNSNNLNNKKVYKTSMIQSQPKVDVADLDDINKKALEDLKSILKDTESIVIQREKQIDLANLVNSDIGLRLIEYHEYLLKKLLSTLINSQENVIAKVYNNTKEYLFFEEVKMGVATISEEFSQAIEVVEILSGVIDVYNVMKGTLDNSTVISDDQLFDYTYEYLKAIKEWKKITEDLIINSKIINIKFN